MFICISNQGEVDPVGLKLMGASSKDADKIGTFGTGWKYGMAVAVRIGGPFSICAGQRTFTVATTTTPLRGHAHNELTLDGVGIGITDQLGKGWEAWMAVREFVSNAIDEGQATVTRAQSIEPETNTTKVYLPFEPFAEVFESLGDYFRLSDEPNQTVTDLGRALPRRDPNQVRIYKRGVLVKALRSSDAAFDYELDAVKIGEDRIATDWEQTLWAFLDKAPLEVKKVVITKSFEAQSYRYGDVNANWKQAFGSKLIVSHKHPDPEALIVPWAFELIAERCGARTLKTDLEAKAQLRKVEPASPTVREACKALKRIGLNVNPKAVLMAEMDQDFKVEDGIYYVKKSLSKDEITDALILAATDGWSQKETLAALIRRIAKL